MAFKLVTGRTGEPHVTSANAGELNAGILSAQTVVLNTGNKLEAEIISNNSIRIKSGTIVDQGRQMSIEAGDYEEVVIENGTQGQKRNDIIAARYEKDESTLIETAELVVIKGTPGSEGVDPELDTGNILNGDEWDEAVLYRVKLDGLNIVAVEPMFDVVLPMAELQEKMTEIEEGVAELNSKNFYGNEKTVSIPSQTVTRVYSNTFSGGIYLITCNAFFGISKDVITGLYMKNVNTNTTHTVRGNMNSAGGMSMAIMVDARASDVTIDTSIYQAHTSATDANCRYSYCKL